MKNLIITLCLVFSTVVLAIGQSLPFQGKLFDNGSPVNGLVSIQFDIVSVGWSETHANVNVVDGLYSVVLGSMNAMPLNIFEGTESQQLDIMIDGVPLTAITIYAPINNNTFEGNLTIMGDGGIQIDNSAGDPEYNGSFISPSSFAIAGTDAEINGLLSQNWMNGGAEGINRGALFLWGDVATRDATGADIMRARMVVADDGFGQDVGQLTLMGPVGGGTINRGLFEAGAYTYDGSNYFGQATMRGMNSDDPLVTLEVQNDGGGNEWGQLVLRHTDGTEAIYDPFGGGGGGGSHSFPYFNVEDENTTNGPAISGNINRDDGGMDAGGYAGWLGINGNDGPNIELGANSYQDHDLPFINMSGSVKHPDGWNYTHVSFNVNQDETTSEEWGHISLQANDGVPNFEFGSKHWEGPGAAARPFMSMSGSIQTEGTDEFGNPNGEFYYPNLVWLEVQDTGDGNEIGAINFSGTDGSEFGISAHGISGNLGFLSLEGLEIQNQNKDNSVVIIANHGPNGEQGYLNLNGTGGQTYVNLNVNDDGSGNEWGSLNLNSPGGYDNIFTNYKTWEANPDLPYIGLRGTIEVEGTDEFGNPNGEFYRPDMVSMDVFDTGDGNEAGGINFSSTDGANFGINAYGLTGIASDFKAKNIIAVAETTNEGNNVIEMFESGDAGFMNVNNSANENAISLDGQTSTIRLNNTSNGNSIWLDGMNGSAWFGTSDNRNISFGPDNGASGGPEAFLPYFFIFGNDGGRAPIDFRILDEGSGDYGRILLTGLGGIGDNVYISGKDGSAYFAGDVTIDGTLNYSGGGGGSTFQGLNIQNPAMNADVASLNQRGTGNNFGELRLFNDAGESKADFRIEDDGAGSNFGFLEVSNNWDNSSIQLNASSGSIRLTDAAGDVTWLNGLALSGLNGINETSIIKDYVSATSNFEVGNYGGSAGTDGAQITADGTFHGNGITTRSNAVVGDFYNPMTPAGVVIESAGNINATGTISSPNIDALSDQRLKENVKPLENSLIGVLNLRGVRYDWKNDTYGSEQEIGVIAQEVEEIYPEFVNTREDGIKTVGYGQMVAVLIEAVKELNTKIESLEGENEKLRADLSDGEEVKEQVAMLQTQIKELQKIFELVSAGETPIENSTSQSQK